MNFQVGDIVIDISEMYLWDNVFHFEKTLLAMNKKIVVNANEKVFTTSDKIKFPTYCHPYGNGGYGCEPEDVQRNLWHQHNGANFDGWRGQYMNLTQDRSKIEMFFKMKYDAAKRKAHDADIAAILNAERMIEGLQRQIETIKAGHRIADVTKPGVTREEHAFLDERYKALLAKLD